MKGWILLAAMTFAAGAWGQGRPDLVAQVENGELQEAGASWWGFDPADATDALQAAMTLFSHPLQLYPIILFIHRRNDFIWNDNDLDFLAVKRLG